jgi:steroid delta-isomerase-like uncharacterized protein
MSLEQDRLLSRRAAVTRLGLGGMATVLAAGNVRVAVAQDASPEAAIEGIPPLLVEWAAAWSSGDPERLAALYAPDAVYEELPTATIARGTDEIRQLVADSHAAFAELQVTPRNGFQAEGWAVLEGDFSFETAEGKPVSVPFVVVLELEGEMIRRSADYFDLNAVLTQMEASPAAATPTT